MSIIKRIYDPYSAPYWDDMYNPPDIYNVYEPYPSPYWVNKQMYNSEIRRRPFTKFMDYGPEPYVIDIDEATRENNTFRSAIWTGENLQVTLMSIDVGDDIGLEVHPTGDQFIRIEEGQGLVKMGDSKDKLFFQEEVFDDFAVMIPAGTWHNIVNTGDIPLKLYAIYAPPEHPRGTVHQTKADAEADEA
ncbi:MAG: cupin domain-containing protein [Vallitalea sp.]|jgi:mannose-6-phosphate isomerase-like protein (cupin superfamily)|nr:cupin domain-containing protein [Vallitalea sp.]